MSGPVLRLKKGHDRARVHPWIFKGDVADVGDVAAGDALTVVDSLGRFVGRGFFNPRPALCCRILTRHDESIDRAFFRRRIDEALRRRACTDVGDDGAVGEGRVELGRLLWSEGDGVPGLVVDRYGDVLAIQCLTLGIARMREPIVAALREAVGDLSAFSADDPVAAGLEGFAPARGWVDRPGPETVVVNEDGVMLRVTFGAGHKTGLYLDQRVNHRRVARLVAAFDGPLVLDAFAYTAAFACHALVAGARGAVCIESSGEALAAARENLALNGVAERVELVAGNVFDELRRLEREGAGFELVVLDPPPFARGRTALEAAARGYKEINLRAMRLLTPGGHLATFSCSHHVSEATFEDICRDAATDAGVTLRVVEKLTQAPDHPVLLTVPETRYLKGLLLERVA
jgi:23S rRNA (cytosine1962-C5)-methyltransferase